MFQNILYMFAFILTPIKMFDREQAEQYVAFETYFLPRFAFGFIQTEEQFEAAIDEFMETLNLDED